MTILVVDLKVTFIDCYLEIEKGGGAELVLRGRLFMNAKTSLGQFANYP
jgi:hypothetical protein